MGWASGSRVLTDVWDVVREHVPVKKRVAVLVRLMAAFARRDCDTLDEVGHRRDWPEAGAAYEAWLAAVPDDPLPPAGRPGGEVRP